MYYSPEQINGSFQKERKRGKVLHDYIHFPEIVEFGSETRTYNASERVLEYNTRRVLLLEVDAAAADCCDGSYVGCLSSVNVAGFVVKWKYKENGNGELVSQVEPIKSESDRQEIIQMLRGTYKSYQINFRD